MLREACHFKLKHVQVSRKNMTIVKKTASVKNISAEEIKIGRDRYASATDIKCDYLWY